MVKAQPPRTDIDFGVLGPLVASVDGTAIRFTGAKERSLLAFLLLHANEMVSVDRLIDALWPDDPPMTARNTLQVHVSRLRKAVGSSRLATFANGYSLTVRPGELDLFRFRELTGAGRRARAEEDAARAAESLREALALWRGQPLPELSENPIFAVESSRLAEEHLAAFEERIEAELDSGEATSLVAELEDAASKNPLRERLMGQLMVALYRAGRQAEALDMYTRTRHRLVAELGLEPGPLLADLHQRILVQDPGLIRERRPRSPLPPPSRRNVTVVLALLPVSADADPEVAERELEDTRQRARTVLEEQGALVSGAGNVIVGTFGLPATNEDDPHRAVRAASGACEDRSPSQRGQWGRARPGHRTDRLPVCQSTS